MVVVSFLDIRVREKYFAAVSILGQNTNLTVKSCGEQDSKLVPACSAQSI
jgi:hypothetical protein